MKLSFQDYADACQQAFSVNMSHPTVYWNPARGFYVAPSRDLVPNDDFKIARANYNPDDGARSPSGSRRSYRPIAAGIRTYFSAAAPGHQGTLHDCVEFARFEGRA